MSNALLNIKRPLNKKTRDNSSVVETHPLVPNYTSRDQNEDNKSKDFSEKSKGFSGTKQNLGPLDIRIYNTKKDMNQRNIQQKVYL